MSLQAHLCVQRGPFRLQVEIEAEAGETIVLLGPNGSGKSTLVEALAGLLPLVEGEVRLDGELLEAAGTGVRVPPQRRPLGVMFQGLWLFPHLSVRDNVAYGLTARGWSRRRAHARIESLLQRLELEALAKRRPAELSGGEAQRVALARAVAAEPRLLLLDEPLSALDLEARPRARSFLQNLLEEFTGIRLLITHDALEALLFADRLWVLEGGRVAQAGRPDELRRYPRTPYVAALAGVNLVSGVLEREEGRPVLKLGNASLSLPALSLPPGSRVHALIPPHAVSVHLQPPEPARPDTVVGRIQSIELIGGRVRLQLDSTPRLFAEVSPESVRERGLIPGKQVFATLESSKIDVYPVQPGPSRGGP